MDSGSRDGEANLGRADDLEMEMESVCFILWLRKIGPTQLADDYRDPMVA